MTRVAFLPITERHGGGIFQYSATLLNALAMIAEEQRALEFVLIRPGPTFVPGDLGAAGRWPIVPLENPNAGGLARLRRVVGEGPHRDAWRAFRRLQSKRRPTGVPAVGFDAITRRPKIEAWWRAQGIKLVIYPHPNPLSFEVGLPYVVAIHDLQHRLQPEFQEVSAGGEWRRREYTVRNCVRNATTILVDSELGKDHVLFFYGAYGVTADRVQVLPFLPASTLPREVPVALRQEILRRYSVPERYVFYPAQFWPHKNHAGIIQALEHLSGARGLRVCAVFCGSHADPVREGHHQLLMEMAKACGVSDQITVLDYVPDEHLSALYSGAVALVMPTFFGPTNIPVLEAWALGCPVLTSGLPGIREQAGDAALLVDPRSVAAIAEGVLRLWDEEELRRDLIDRGKRRLAACTPGSYRDRVRRIVADAARKV